MGLRAVSSELDVNGSRLFRVNGHRLLVRGAGYTPDLLLRFDAARLAAELYYARHAGLNALRLEGKALAHPSALYDACDRQGLLVLAGWCCCDAWQDWPAWGPEQLTVARESMRARGHCRTRRLRAAR